MIKCKRILLNSDNEYYGVEAIVDEKKIVMAEKTQGGHWDTKFDNGDQVWIDIEDEVIYGLCSNMEELCK
jgi:hypothetical protein